MAVVNQDRRVRQSDERFMLGLSGKREQVWNVDLAGKRCTRGGASSQRALLSGWTAQQTRLPLVFIHFPAYYIR
jgi:hypothetical protein